ncbi:hypothetical protein SAMN05660226_04154 [Parapedobacter luteus]|uniref:Uncharacterized protein n=1 Tax=Parapedobacter luteus TaxID=623280 RepID=A0A1T5FRY7_9SPHI|nr:hypothetical protein SAMN05660226_04154 [Parapedobacter luteus]
MFYTPLYPIKMNDSYYSFPNIMQSIVLVVLIFVCHFVAKLVFSFIEDHTLVSLLSEVFKLCLLLFFLRYMTKWDNIDATQFKMASPNMLILACGVLCALCIAFFPSPRVLDITSMLTPVTGILTPSDRSWVECFPMT